MLADETQLKPMLTEEQLVDHLKEKGVRFQLYGEVEAIAYLRDNTNYFKLASYRKNYEKYQGGKNDGKYINLDFGYLRDLAIIDMKLRYALVQLALDIEHYAKLEILRQVGHAKEDGYSICDNFISSLNEQQRNRLVGEIERNKNNIYCGDLFSKYPEHFPIWVFLELIPFGRMVSLYGFCAERFQLKKMSNQYYMLLACKDVRNAAAHSSCILNDLHINTQKRKAQFQVMNRLSEIKEIPADSRIKRMSNARVQEIVTLLYCHNEIVTSGGVHDMAIDVLSEFAKRMMKHLEFYKENDLINANLNFLKSVIDKWYFKK